MVDRLGIDTSLQEVQAGDPHEGCPLPDSFFEDMPALEGPDVWQHECEGMPELESLATCRVCVNGRCEGAGFVCTPSTAMF